VLERFVRLRGYSIPPLHAGFAPLKEYGSFRVRSVISTVELSLYDEMSNIGQPFQNGANHQTGHLRRIPATQRSVCQDKVAQCHAARALELSRLHARHPLAAYTKSRTD
jgi:hypothetical protein